MKKLLIAAIATVGFAGAAAAQQAPFIAGDYSSNVLQNYNQSYEGGAAVDMSADMSAEPMIDFGTTASIDTGAVADEPAVVEPGDVNTANPEQQLGR